MTEKYRRIYAFRPSIKRYKLFLLLNQVKVKKNNIYTTSLDHVSGGYGLPFSVMMC